jgi:flagellar biosynthesis GTPase FlhF
MNNIRTEITKTVDQLRVLLGMFEGFNLQEESQEQTRAQEQAQAQEPAQEEIVNIFESAPAPCPAPARLQVNFQSSYLRNKATPTIKNYINMIIDRGFNEEICDNLINLYATSVWKFCTTLHNYGIAANNIQRLQINHLQDWTTLCTVFDVSRYIVYEILVINYH